ncbi:marine proteobacterial sortase target protein [Anaerohalosphaera lusitana]|uniref:Marine proteobacterial sortase target protein n=1 Tax=Anaerohalosphaera lusitana TaxID=1936003 RepID=A0A1U9NKY8_9BACT|nr:VWA domain-containing protein [Anaerohalosphaera lusitana]AQT68467.1 marine proteobacterial sortase target protein [Anaerohalosphaera lusitana]
MIFLNPIWLLLAIPSAALLWFYKTSSKLITVLRILSVAFVILAMAGLAVDLPSKRGTVVVVADRSASMPPQTQQQQEEAIDLIREGMGDGDELAVVSFGQDIAIDMAPQRGRFGGFVTQVGPHASNLADGIFTALSMIPAQAPGRVVVLSDGRWTGSDPLDAASRAATMGVAVDYRKMSRPAANDLAIERIQAPQQTTPGEAFMLTAWFQSPLSQGVKYALSKNGETIAASDYAAGAGLNRLTFRDKTENPGTNEYYLRIEGDNEDPVPENNTARMLVGVTGPKSVLCLTESDVAGFVNMLRASKIDVEPAQPGQVNFSLEGLSNYSSLIIENTPAQGIGPRGMENIAAWVKQTGAGLMMTGGKSSYGPGGYFKSPIEPILPVSMELRREHRKFSLGIVVVLDRSGSMGAPVSGGKTKMDLANLATAQVLDLLGPEDEFGVIAVDSSAHTIVDIAKVKRNKAYRNKILTMESMGGGIFIYEALTNAAKMVSEATPLTRHIILFADAADSERPDAYKELLEKCEKAGITVSVIGLGNETNIHANLLKDIAERGNGRCFFTESAEELPRLFAQDTFVVARNSFLDEATAVETMPGLRSVTNRSFDMNAPAGGYNLCYLRPEATLGAVTLDEYDAPFIASWQVGVGRGLAYAGQVDGKYTGPLGNSPQYEDMLTSLVRWVAGDPGDLGPDMMVTQEMQGAECVIKLHLDPAKAESLIDELPTVTALSGTPGSSPATSNYTMQFDDTSTLSLRVPISGLETVLSTVNVASAGPVSLPPVCLPYSPEFKPVETGRDGEVLEKLAAATHGQARIDLGGIWDDIPRKPQTVPVGKWLLFAAIVLLLLEVLQRRTNLLTRAKPAVPAFAKERISRLQSARLEKAAAKRAKKAGRKIKIADSQPDEKTEQPAKKQKKDKRKKQEPKTGPGLSGALSKAKKSADQRTDRK